MTTGIEDLPDSVMHHIFSYLHPFFLVKIVLFVNARWKNLVQRPSFWGSIRYVRLNEWRVGRYFIENVLEKSANLEHLVILFKSRRLNLTKVAMPRLQSLCLINLYPEMEEAIINMVKGAPHIRRVKLRGGLIQSLTHALSDLNELTSIDLNVNIEPGSLIRVFQKSPRLEEVKIQNNINNMEDFQCLMSHHCATLKSLSWITQLEDNGAKLIARCTALSELDLYCDRLTDNALKFIQNMSSLTSLFLYCNSDLSSEVFIQFFEGSCFHNLKRLGLMDLSNLSDPVLDTISRKYPNLEALYLEGNNSTTITGLSKFLERCRCLRILKLYCPKFNCFLLINDLSMYLPQLSYLQVTERVSDRNFVEKFTKSHPNYRRGRCVRLKLEYDEIEDLYEGYHKYSQLNPVLVYCYSSYRIMNN